ncbi:MAG: hypothetical protein DMG05_21655 [Acidobacteria bacterium]|nr:MAG: hypothetical protein DMG05_21655 [Acidobacteriota bacterium]
MGTLSHEEREEKIRWTLPSPFGRGSEGEGLELNASVARFNFGIRDKYFASTRLNASICRTPGQQAARQLLFTFTHFQNWIGPWWILKVRVPEKVAKPVISIRRL